MHITKNIQSFICFEDSSISIALQKINENRLGIVFITNEHGKLLGSLSDGDFRRAVLSGKKLDIDLSVNQIMNQNARYSKVDAKQKDIRNLFESGIKCIPLLNSNHNIVSIALENKNGIIIEDIEISDDSKVFIIAEIGNNHQGDINLAKKLIDVAKEANVDCVKFQMRNMSSLYKNKGNPNDESADLGAQYTLDLLSKFQLSNEELFEAFDYARSVNILPLCTPWDIDSLLELEKYGMPAYKIASADFTNYSLLDAVANTSKPFFCSTGMSTELEINQTVSYLNKISAQYALLHCNSTYPTPFKDVNLNYLKRLKENTNQIIGYSGHERGISVSIAAVALGAKIIEKHITLDKNLEGTDHKVSLLPEELKSLVKSIRAVEESLGNDQPRIISQGELLNRENLAKSIVAAEQIKLGETITRQKLEIKSPGLGLQPNMLDKIVGVKANRNIEAGDFLYASDYLGQIVKKEYSFNRPFGIPVRFHDYFNLIEGTNLDFVEFHLSYKDLEFNFHNLFKKEQGLGFAVHCPELFAEDHILDLSSEDQNYRNLSISNLITVISLTKEMKKYFPKTRSPVLVINAGGWSLDSFIVDEEKSQKYKRISDAFKEIDLSGITIAIQTMPPFPWHFGGQRFHNLFVNDDEIINFCNKNPNIKICLDVSHSMMACSYYGWDIFKFIEKISPFNVHMHVTDSKGSDGEGVEIGKGDVDFSRLCSALNNFSPDIQFIPEIWQGHKNSGAGFWSALSYLEKVFGNK